jgi:UDP-N-acetylmuramyl pentapeptide synthase
VAAIERIITNVSDDSSQPAADWAILVKGSRGMEMEEIVAGLRGDV